MSGIDNNHVSKGEIHPYSLTAYESSVPSTAGKANRVGQQNIAANLDFTLASTFADSFSSISSLPLLGLSVGLYCKNNRDANRRNKGNPAPGQKTIHADPKKMGVFQRWGFVHVERVNQSVCGQEVEVVYHPRRWGSTESQAEIVGGPEELVGLSVSGFNSFQKGWKGAALKALEKLVAPKLKPIILPFNSEYHNADGGLTSSTPDHAKTDQTQPQQGSVDNPSHTGFSLDPIDHDLNGESTPSTTDHAKTDQAQPQQTSGDNSSNGVTVRIIHHNLNSESTPSTPDHTKTDQAQPQQTSGDNSSNGVTVRIIYHNNAGSTTLINDSSSAAVPVSSDHESNARLIESIGPDDITMNAEANRLRRNIQEARKEKNRVKADPHATGEEKKKAVHDFNESFDKALKVEYAGRDPLSPPKQQPTTLREALEDACTQIEKSIVESGSKLEAQTKRAQQNRQQATNMQNRANLLRNKLESNPTVSKITINTKKGPLTLTRAEAFQRINTFEQKAQIHRNHSKIDPKDIAVGAKNRATGELLRAGKQIKGTVTTQGLSILTDRAFDYLEGKREFSAKDLSDAAQSIGWGTVEQTGSSVLYEGVKGGINTYKTTWAEKIPGLGWVVFGYNSAATLYNAKTLEQGVKDVASMGANYGAEMAATSVLTFATGGTGPLVLVGAKVSVRGAKMVWNWMRQEK